MAVVLPDTEIVTDPCRVAYPAVFDKKPKFQGSPVEVYSAVILIPPEMDLSPFHAVMKAAMLKQWNKLVKVEGRSNPLRKCEETPSLANLAGWHAINASSPVQPQVVDQRAQEVFQSDRLYGGMWCRFHLRCWAWDNKFGKGLSFQLNSLQLIKDDARLDGRVAAKNIFAPVAGDGGALADAPTTEGGDEELFG